MKTLFAICALAGVIALVDIPVQQSVGSGEALAQSRSSACFQKLRQCAPMACLPVPAVLPWQEQAVYVGAAAALD